LWGSLNGEVSGFDPSVKKELDQYGDSKPPLPHNSIKEIMAKLDRHDFQKIYDSVIEESKMPEKIDSLTTCNPSEQLQIMIWVRSVSMKMFQKTRDMKNENN